MDIESNHILGAIAIGLGATFGMDLWNVFLRRTIGIQSLNYCLLGRWVSHMPSGTFTHASIAAARPKPFECPIGWIAHYATGIGIGTVVMPLFIMQPSLGLGLGASKTPKPTQARLKSLMTHTVFGLGLYLSALGVGYCF